jgi:stage III sporulation protein AD
MLILCADFIKSVADFISYLAELAGMSDEILSPVLKTIGIGIVTKLCSQVCRDAGEGAIATLTDFAGTAAALFVSIPLMKAVIEMVTQML